MNRDSSLSFGLSVQSNEQLMIDNLQFNLLVIQFPKFPNSCLKDISPKTQCGLNRQKDIFKCKSGKLN